MNKLGFLLLSYVLAMALAYIFAVSVVETFDQDDIDEWSLSEEQIVEFEADDGVEYDPESYMMQVIFFLSAAVVLVLHIVYLVLCLVIVKDNIIDMKLFVLTKGEKGYNIFRWIWMMFSAIAAGLLSWNYLVQTTASTIAQLLLLVNIMIAGVWIINFVMIKKGKTNSKITLKPSRLI